MKLKKIASLALAGIMAVSMLAGCKDGGNSNNGDNGNTDITVSSSTASTLRAEMGGNARAKVTAVANSKLDSALKDAIDNYVNNDTLANIYKKNYNDGLDVRKWNVGKAVIEAMDAKNSVADDISMSNNKTTTAVEIYAFDSRVSDQAVLEWVADKIDE